MRRRLAGVGVVLAFLAVAALTLPSASAKQQFGSPQATNVSPNVLYLKPEVVARQEIPPEQATQCTSKAAPTAKLPIHGMSTEPPTSAEPDRVYRQGAATVYYDCDTAFRYEVEESFSLERGATASMWVNCHRATPVVADARDANPTFNWAFVLRRNGEQIARSDGSVESSAPAGPCHDALGTSDTVFHGVFESVDVTFHPGDTLQLHFALFNQVTPGNTTYLMVDGFNRASALYGPGLPGTVRPAPGSTLGAEPPNATATTGPGNATTITVPLRNDGSSARTVEVDLEAPSDWPARPDRGSVTVPARGTATLNLTVAAPPDAITDAVAEHRITLTSGGEELVFETTTRAVHGAGSPTDLVSTDVGEGSEGAPMAPGNLSDTDGGGAQTASEDGGLAQTVSELWVEALATAIVATIGAAIGVVME